MPRLDIYLVEAGFSISRNKAQELLKDGMVLVNQKVETKPAKFIDATFDKVELVNSIQSETNSTHYVSRSAKKLLFALNDIYGDSKNKKISNKICLDIGASTGGWTQVLLELGAKKVYALDVGTSQLSPIIKQNQKVIDIQQTNIRDYQIPQDVEIIVCDASFISLKLIFESIYQNITTKGQIELFFLIKPQFEVGKDKLRKFTNAVITDELLIEETITDITTYAVNFNIEVKKILPSKVVGKNGNQEYILWGILTK